MVIITDSAAEKAKEILTAEGKSGWGIRLFIEGEGCHRSFGLDIDEKAGAQDDVVEKNGLKVFVDRNMAPMVSGLTIDYLSSDRHEGFVLTGGASSCGSSCGPDHGHGGHGPSSCGPGSGSSCGCSSC